jgi:cell fate regulator YaaT (PSP1 superfamily)
MGCANCSNSGGVPRGCKNNGTCSSGGCDKLGVFNWLSNMALPNGQKMYDIVEVRFKNSRKGFFRYNDAQNLHVGDAVVVDTAPGFDVGIVSIVGDLVRIQLNKKAPDFKYHEAKAILRKANQEDLDIWKEARALEFDTMHKARKHAIALNLDMKISDVEYQADKTKATFYYTAESRVDFRELIRIMAGDFKVKIEMRQIGSRQEASRLGGIGSCGRELCCSTWLTDFRSVSTSAARYQQLSLNPQKLAGQCGKLKCCLNYELDMYVEAIKDFPSTDIKLQTQKGRAFHIKTDVFKRQLWYLQESNDREFGGSTMVMISPERAKEVIAMNKAGEKPVDLKDFEEEKPVVVQDYTNVVGQDSLDRFDDTFKKKKKKKKKPSSGQQNAQSNQVNQQPREKLDAGPDNKNQNQQTQRAKRPEQTRPTGQEGQANKQQPRNEQRADNPQKANNPRTEAKGPQQQAPQGQAENTGEANKNKSSRNRNKRRKPKNDGQQNNGEKAE